MLSEDERSDVLRQAAARKSEEAVARASRAINKLESSRQAVTFVAVAEASGVSRGFLYKHDALRERITLLRSTGPLPTSSGVPPSEASLRAKYDLLTTQLRSMQADNQALRDELEVLRGALIEAEEALARRA